MLIKKKKKNSRNNPPDYGTGSLTGKETAEYTAVYLFLEMTVSFLFFDHWIPAIVFLAGLPLFLANRKKNLAQKRKREMRVQFLTGMQLMANAMQAGYAVENAFREAADQLRKVYAPEDFIIREFCWMLARISVNVPVEQLLLDLGERSHVEDIRNFSEVFETARKTGGDLIAIIKNTNSLIAQKEETSADIETTLAGKRMEQNLMSVIPLLILAYVRLSSPGFLDPMYHTLAGRGIMCGCLACYGAAYVWGRKIMEILVE